jgi:hypothetical protein
MPKKRNFLGGMQNYNPKNGEYESALVGPNGKVAKDVDGDGKEHESKKGSKDYQGTVDKLNKEFGLSAENGFKLAKTDDPAYSGVNILHPTGRGMTPNELEYALEKGTLKGYEELANQREKAMREGTYQSFSKFGKAEEEDAASTFDKINAKRMGYELPKESKKPELLSKEYLDSFYEKADGDEDKMLDLIRADEEYQNSFDDPNTTWSMGDLQGIIEAYMDKKTGKNMIERYREKLSKNRLPF